ncbi:MAG: outer membrane lipoprotein carrier protein LolA [Balneolaceae bacterium]|nr:MAG: outer membrane lipoprotein carrier protein LolA [Balneolaceae bacterium]
MEFKTASAALLLSLFLFPSVLISQSAPQFEALKERFDRQQVFAAEFIHEFNDAFTGENQITEGEIHVGKTRYRMVSGENRMLVDGELSMVYDSSRNRVIYSDYVEEDDDFAPSRMLQGVDDHFSVSERSVDNGELLITLTSNDPFSLFEQVYITLDRYGIPLKIEAVDQVENRLTTRFSSGRFVREDEQLFVFSYPEDAERIDLRDENP